MVGCESPGSAYIRHGRGYWHTGKPASRPNPRLAGYGTAFTIQINPDNGLFAWGCAEAELFADECNFGVCVFASVSQDVKLQAVRR